MRRMTTGRMSTVRRLRAPRDDRGVLIDPPWSAWSQLTETNNSERSHDDCDLGGIRLAALAGEARREIIEAATAYTRAYRDVAVPSGIGPAGTGSSRGGSAGGGPADSAYADRLPRVVAAGHQPELFHPGVWAKNFALSHFARQIDAVPINLVVDGDVLDAASIRVPTGSPADSLVESGPRIETVAFDAAAQPQPHEERRVLDDDTWRTFGIRAAETLRPLVRDPLVERFWPTVVECSRRTGRIGSAIAQARHRWEGEWGAGTLELPQSLLCETRSFLRFTAYLVQEADRFVEIHNRSLLEYRRQAGIRSANHPVPALAADGDQRELPLWLWTADDPRRRHVFLRRSAGELELTDRGRVSIRLPTDSPAAAVQRLADSAAQGVRLRSRALLTTMYARLVLSDFFLHGIGGAKYDELTDTIVERFFRVRPPTYGVVTATRKLPISARDSDRHADPSAVEHRLWEMTHHPDRFVDPATIVDSDEARQAREMIEKKARLIAAPPSTGEARARCQAIRGLNSDLQRWLAEPRRRAALALESARRAEQVGGVVGSREYAFCLFPEKDLRDFLVEIPRR
jgi:hypothetical protein